MRTALLVLALATVCFAAAIDQQETLEGQEGVVAIVPADDESAAVDPSSLVPLTRNKRTLLLKKLKLAKLGILGIGAVAKVGLIGSALGGLGGGRGGGGYYSGNNYDNYGGSYGGGSYGGSSYGGGSYGGGSYGHDYNHGGGYVQSGWSGQQQSGGGWSSGGNQVYSGNTYIPPSQGVHTQYVVSYDDAPNSW